MSWGPRSAYALLCEVRRRAGEPDEEPPPSSRPTRPMGPPKPRRAPKARRKASEAIHPGFSGVLRPGSRVLVKRSLRCGEVVFQAGIVAVVTQTFPSLCLRAELEPHAAPVIVSFEQAVAATVKLPTTIPPKSNGARASVEIEFEVQVL